jgi:hypothetical protein
MMDQTYTVGMRDILLIIGISVIAVMLGLSLFLFGPKSLQSDVSNAFLTGQVGTPGHTGFIVLEQGSDATSIAQRTNYRITSVSDLQALWPLIYGERDAPPIPEVNFDNYEVIAVFDGSHAGGGYDVGVTEILDNNPVRTISVNHELPNPACPTKGPSSPYELIQVPKTNNSLAHEDVTSVSVCSAN